MPAALHLTPHGRLAIMEEDDAAPIEPGVAGRILPAFERGSGHGLLRLGASGMGAALPPVFSYWRDFASRYVAAVCMQPDSAETRKRMNVAAPSPGDLDHIVRTAPFMTGAEYLNTGVLQDLWQELDAAFHAELAESKLALQDFLRGLNPAWNLLGRVHFNIAEHRKDSDAPFAFLATYTTRLSAQAKAQHLPLGQALREYAGAANRDRLLSLLMPVQRASEKCPWLKEMVDSGEIFQPLRWTVADAVRLLKDAPELEAAGVILRTPASWRGNRPPRPRVRGTVGTKPPSSLGHEALLDFRVEVAIDGEPLTPAELRELLSMTDGLAFIRGRWVELDRDGLQSMLDRFTQIERISRQDGLAFGEAMRLLAGAGIGGDAAAAEVDPDWAQVVAGPWLEETLNGLRTPQALAAVDPGDALKGALRPYQQVGLRWLHFFTTLRLGACLADDMGLGKTIQVLSLLLVLKRQKGAGVQPSILVAPASLLANWASEIERFAPGLRALVAHPSAMSAAELKDFDTSRLDEIDLVITSYGSTLRMPWITEVHWRLAVLDEAQAIRNPGAKQTRAVKKLKAGARLALTGTPVENRLGDLWSIFDFINPGLLGGAKQFTAFAKQLAKRKDGSYGPLRELVRPYILRRLKTDKAVISDLPDKTEIKAFCPLSRPQAALYEQAVREMAKQLAEAEGIQRRGLVLAYLMRFKQICNHPSQWLGDGDCPPPYNFLGH